MAVGSVSVQGIKALDKALESFAGNIGQTAKLAIDNALGEVEQAIKNNVTSVFNKGYSRGLMMQSVSHTAVIAKNGVPSGTVGVYNMSNKTGFYNTTKEMLHPVPAPLMAFFYETGIQPHSLAKGSRAEQRPTPGQPFGRAARGQHLKPHHPGSGGPNPFVTNAFLANSSKITEEAIKQFNIAAGKIQ